MPDCALLDMLNAHKAKDEDGKETNRGLSLVEAVSDKSPLKLTQRSVVARWRRDVVLALEPIAELLP